MIDIRHEGHVAFLRPREASLDREAVQELREILALQITQGMSLLIINLESVTYMDSSGLGALISAFRQLDGTGELRLCGARPDIINLIHLAGLNRIFPVVFDDEEQALRAGAGRPH
ncbi:MAG: STAS domain-containing protein [Gemmatimonadetes bacterium]|nr:STAS domain-containing protein [Gemmatimonadota bacterium]